MSIAISIRCWVCRLQWRQEETHITEPGDHLARRTLHCCQDHCFWCSAGQGSSWGALDEAAMDQGW